MRLVNIAFIAFFATISITHAIAQDIKDVFDRKTKITWLGIDLTKAKFIGDRERFGSESDTRSLIESWNKLMRDEKDKYYIKSAVKKDETPADGLDVTMEHNANVEVMDMYAPEEKEEPQHMTQADIQAIVSDYDFKGLRGQGVMFVVESFDKKRSKANIWVTFVDMDNKQVLFTEMLTGYPGGAGLRNYWAASIKVVMEKMRDKEFDKWRKKYNPRS